MIKFNKGAPPSVGWWPATFNPRYFGERDKEYIPLRWWNGKCWSVDVSSESKSKFAGRLANIGNPFPEPIYWCKRWWE